MAILTRLDDVQRALETSPTIAVIGASTRSSRAGCYVPAYLRSQGYRVVPINPMAVGEVLHGETVVATLAEAGPVDLVDIFRRPDQLPAHLEELLAAAPRTVWFQLGIRHDEVANALAAAGIDVVQDRCILADHRAWGLGAPRPGPSTSL